MELLVIRHGRPERVENASGTADPPLNADGHEQSRLIARVLENEGIDAVISSPMLRALQTAEPTAELLGIVPHVVADLAEIDRDASDYVPTEEIKRNDPERWAEIVADPMSLHDAEMEPFRARVLAAFDALIEDNPGRKLVVFCHGMVTMVLLQSILGYPDVHTLTVDYASISRVQASSTAGVRSVRSVNETTHLGPVRITW